MADMFIVEWFGDLPVILDDQSQSAAIRTRLVERVGWLHDRGCQDVVLVAHSGGTIVSFATLLRYDHDAFKVAKLVTLGEAIKLGWRLEDESRDWVPGNSVRGDLKVNHPDLKWVDIWASYDPAPSGELVETGGQPADRRRAALRQARGPAHPRREPAGHELHAPGPRSRRLLGRTTRGS